MSVGLASATSAQQTYSATFVVLLRGSRVGTESMSVARTGGGWQITSTGRLLAPFDLSTSRFEMRYAADWQPQQLTIEAVLRGQPSTLTTTFGLTTATNDLAQGAQRATNVHQLSARAVVLPANFFAAYEALTARLATAAPGTRLPVYVAP
ncbi:MAG: hypothetical protein ABI652_06405, partial [Acidobacteriota bacterium]